MRSEFKTYAGGALGTLRFNLDILKGQNPVGITLDRNKIVRAQKWGAPEIIGSRVLSTNTKDNKAVINFERGKNVSINYAPNYDREHMTWNITADSENNIRDAIPQKAVADKIIGELNHTQSAYDDGEMGYFDVYKIDHPQHENGDEYIRVKSMKTKTPSGRVSRLVVDSFDADGNKTSLNIGDNEMHVDALIRKTADVAKVSAP